MSDIYTLRHCSMAISFDVGKFVGSLPGALIFGTVFHEEGVYAFAKESILIPERRLADFMKILQCLSKNVILENEDSAQEAIEVKWDSTNLLIEGKSVQCRKGGDSFSIVFNLSYCLAFLIAIRKVAFWLVAPTKTEFDSMDFFVRYTINNSAAGFPKITQMEEDIKSSLSNVYSKERIFYLNHFLINHHVLLEFQYNLYLLTIKK